MMRSGSGWVPRRGVGLALVDRDAGVLLLDDAGAGALDGQVGGEREDFAAGGHYLAHGDVVQLDGAVDDLFLEGGKQAHAAGRGSDQLELFRRVDGALAVQRSVEETQHMRGGDVHQANGGAADADDDVHGAGNGEGDALGALQGERLRHKLTEQKFKVSDRGEGDDDRRGVRVEESVGREHGEPVSGEIEQHLGDGGLTQPAQGERGEGDTELDGGQELVDVLFQVQRTARAWPAEGDQLLHARLAHADEGELRGHEEAVGQDEEGHHHRAEEHHFQHSC